MCPPPMIRPGCFPGPRAYLHPPPPPGVPGPYPDTRSLPSVDPRYIMQYPVCPGLPGFPPSLTYPPPGDFSYQGPTLTHGIVNPVTMARPPVPPVAPPDIPHFKIYIGKIAPTVDNDFVLSLLQVCGVVKSWEPVTNPIDGTHTGFAFCEFESAEGSLRARRLLNKLSVDGQELVLNVNQATRDYFQKYGESTLEGKAKEAETGTRDGAVSLADNGNDLSRVIPEVTTRGAVGVQMSTEGETKRCQNGTEEYSDADKDAMQRIRSMIEERTKSKLPGSPTPVVQVSACTADDNGSDDARSSALEERKIRRQCEKEEHLGERKAVDSQGQKDREVTAAGKSSLQIDAALSMQAPMERESTVEHGRRSQHRKRHGFRKSNGEEEGRERKAVGLEGQKDREVTAAGKSSKQIDEVPSMHVRMERESKAEHDRKSQHREKDGFRKSNGEEKGRERKAVGSEGQKDREVTAAGKSSLQIDEALSMHVHMERESTVEHERKSQHRERDRFRKSNGEEKGRERKYLGSKGQKDREVTAAGKFSLQIDEVPSMHVRMERESTVEHERKSQHMEKKCRERKALGSEGQKGREATAAGKSSLQIDEEPSMHIRMERESTVEHERKSQHRERDGFCKSNGEEKCWERKAVGLEGQKDREVAAAGKSSLQIDEAPSMHVRMERESVVEHERKSQHRERDGFPKSNGDDKGIVFVPGLVSDKQNISAREKVGFEFHAISKSGDKKTLDAKQLLATVPKAKEEVFAHDVNWAIYDKYGLHERMRPWISKKTTEVFGEDLAEFVDYVVATTKEHVTAPRMLELLESLLDNDAEKFVLLMWRILIFEIKKVEEGLA